MRFLRLTMALLLLAPAALMAQEQKDTVERLENPDAQSLATKPVADLLEQLKRERQPETAKAISGAILIEWSDSGSPTVNLMMQWAADALKKKNNAAALDFLDQAIVLEPDFAEAWHRRATLHYAMNDYRKAVSDLNHVLQLQPRHFAALSGLAAILTETGRDAKALEAWQRYLDIYPADRDAQEAVTTLSEKLAGSRT